MSLRILLADKSTSIDRVFRLGLQNFGAEIKSVQSGLDVLPVTESYQPHIVFADILLQKKNGYEVCKELNRNQKTRHIPVVLMWSSFMELDPKEYQNCGAKAELEKPFEIEDLRQVVNFLIKENQGQNVSEPLDFPKNIKDFPKNIKTGVVQREKPRGQENRESEPDFSFTLDQQENQKTGEGFESDQTHQQQKQLGSIDKENVFAESIDKFKLREQGDESHSFFNLEAEQDSDSEEIIKEEEEENRDSDRFGSVDLQEENRDSDRFEPVDLQTDKKLELGNFLFQPESGENSSSDMEKPGALEFLDQNEGGVQEDPPTPTSVNQGSSPVSPEARVVLEKAIREQLPGIVEKVVREELEKIFQQEMAIKKSNQN